MPMGETIVGQRPYPDQSRIKTLSALLLQFCGKRQRPYPDQSRIKTRIRNLDDSGIDNRQRPYPDQSRIKTSTLVPTLRDLIGQRPYPDQSRIKTAYT